MSADKWPFVSRSMTYENSLLKLTLYTKENKKLYMQNLFRCPIKLSIRHAIYIGDYSLDVIH